MKIYRETALKIVAALAVLQFFIGPWLPSTVEMRWITLTFMFVAGLYFPSKKEQENKK